MDARRAPEGICNRHGADEIREFRGDPWSTRSSAPGLPGPVGAEALPMPANHSVGSNEERLTPPIPLLREPHPEEPIEAPELRTLRSAAEQGELLPERQVLKREVGAGSERCAQGAQQSEHEGHCSPWLARRAPFVQSRGEFWQTTRSERGRGGQSGSAWSQRGAGRELGQGGPSRRNLPGAAEDRWSNPISKGAPRCWSFEVARAASPRSAASTSRTMIVALTRVSPLPGSTCFEPPVKRCWSARTSTAYPDGVRFQEPSIPRGTRLRGKRCVTPSVPPGRSWSETPLVVLAFGFSFGWKSAVHGSPPRSHQISTRSTRCCGPSCTSSSFTSMLMRTSGPTSCARTVNERSSASDHAALSPMTYSPLSTSVFSIRGCKSSSSAFELGMLT